MDKAMHSDGKKKVSRFEFAIMQAAGIDQTNVEPKTKEEEIQERIDNLKNQASRIRIKNTSSSYIPTKEVPPEETAQALRTKFREKNIECESLRSELQKQKEEIANHIAVNSLLTDSEGEADLANKLYQCQSELAKQKELNAELVRNECEAFTDYLLGVLWGITWPVNFDEQYKNFKAESLIKKSKEQ